MRTFILSIAFALLATLSVAQEPTKEIIEDTDSNDRIEAKRTINGLVNEWEQLFYVEKGLGDILNAATRKARFDAGIAECTTFLNAAANRREANFWQGKIDSLTARRDLLDDNTPSTEAEVHPRWEAGQRLTTRIADLVTKIDDLKTELAALP